MRAPIGITLQFNQPSNDSIHSSKTCERESILEFGCQLLPVKRYCTRCQEKSMNHIGDPPKFIGSEPCTSKGPPNIYDYSGDTFRDTFLKFVQPVSIMRYFGYVPLLLMMMYGAFHWKRTRFRIPTFAYPWKHTRFRVLHDDKNISSQDHRFANVTMTYQVDMPLNVLGHMSGFEDTKNGFIPIIPRYEPTSPDFQGNVCDDVRVKMYVASDGEARELASPVKTSIFKKANPVDCEFCTKMENSFVPRQSWGVSALRKEFPDGM